MARRFTLSDWVDWRQPGGVVSAGAHVVLLVAAVVGFNTTKPFMPAEEASPVDIVSESQFNEMMKGDVKGEKKPEVQQRTDHTSLHKLLDTKLVHAVVLDLDRGLMPVVLAVAVRH